MVQNFIRKNAFLLLLLLVVVAVPSVYAFNYMQNDPKFCTTCHLMNNAFDTWNSSAMHDLNCHVCHESDMTTNIGHLVSVIVEGTSVVTKPVKIDNKICENCHVNNDTKWLQVADTAGHKIHVIGDL